MSFTLSETGVAAALFAARRSVRRFDRIGRSRGALFLFGGSGTAERVREFIAQAHLGADRAVLGREALVICVDPKKVKENMRQKRSKSAVKRAIARCRMRVRFMPFLLFWDFLLF